jgi:outer membrane lipoprotein SlyB
VELMIEVECAEQQCQQYMVIQDFDQQMVFHNQDAVRMVYLANGNVRIDKQF